MTHGALNSLPLPPHSRKGRGQNAQTGGWDPWCGFQQTLYDQNNWNAWQNQEDRQHQSWNADQGFWIANIKAGCSRTQFGEKLQRHHTPLDWQTGEREGSQDYQGGQNEADRGLTRWGTEQALGHDTQQSALDRTQETSTARHLR